jgi:hypothetical protein
MQRIPARRHGSKEEKSSIRQVDAGLGLHQKEEE